MTRWAVYGGEQAGRVKGTILSEDACLETWRGSRKFPRKSHWMWKMTRIHMRWGCREQWFHWRTGF